HGHLPKPPVVRTGHIVKTQAKPFVVRSGQRIHALQINIIANHHSSFLTELAFDASRSIRQDDRFYSHAGEHADRENYLLGRISFIEMYAALHPGHRHSSHFSDHQLPGVPDGGRPREIRDLPVRNFGSSENSSAKAPSPDPRTRAICGRSLVREKTKSAAPPADSNSPGDACLEAP